MSQYSVEVICRRGDAELLGDNREAGGQAVARISAAGLGEELSLSLDGEEVWTGSSVELVRAAEAMENNPARAFGELLAGVGAKAYPAEREAIFTSLLAYRAGGAVDNPARDDEESDALLRDIFLLGTEDGLKRQPHLYIPLRDPFFDEHSEAFERLLDLGLLARVDWKGGPALAGEITRYCTRLNVPLVAGYRYDMQSPISGPTHRVWRRIRFYMEMGFRRFLPEELREKMGGKPAGDA